MHGERLGDQRHAFLQEASIHGGILRIACHEKDLQIRTDHARRVGKLPTIEAGKTYIGHEEINRAWTLQDF